MIVFDQLKKNDPHLRAVTWGVLIGMAILVAGLWWVQIISYRHYSENQKAQSFRTVRIAAIRGKILDRNGAAMAENRPSYNVNLYLDELRAEFRAEYARARKPQLVTNALPSWKRWLGFSTVETKVVRLTLTQRRALEAQARYRVASNSVFQVAQRLQQPVTLSVGDFMRHYTNQLALPFPVLTNLDATQVSRLLEQSSNPPGIDLEVLPMRHYPGATTAAHALGFLLRDNRSNEGELADFNFRLPDYRGRIGVEGSFDADLRGKAGAKSVLVNSLGYRQSENIWTPAEPGKNVVLTIDLAIQQAAELALHNYSASARGAVVVLDCNNGDILAMASSPAFDPNWYIPFLKPTYSEFLNDETAAPQKNRATQMNYRPGSIFKIVSGLACLEAGLNPNEKIHCSGEIWIGRRRIDDLAPPGDYDFRRAFIKSSNAYFITNGLKYGFENVVKLGQQLHLGEKSGMLTGQEVTGTFPDLKSLQRGWTPGDSANVCIGQGKLDTTPMQMALVVAAVANGGNVLWPRLVDRIEPPEPHSDQQVILFPSKPVRNRLPVKQRNLELVRQAMVADVEDPDGTGFKAFHEGDLKTPLLKNFRVGGKTGTAEVEREGRNLDKTTWFASFGPFENPRYVVVAMVENGGSGGGTCAPITMKVYRAIQKMEAERGPQFAGRN